jgi:hypothetical protein
MNFGVLVTNPTASTLPAPITKKQDFTIDITHDGILSTALFNNGFLLFELVNVSGDPTQATISVADSSGSGLFAGSSTLTWQSGDTGTQYILFNNFVLQADQVTPTDRCNYVPHAQNTVEIGNGTHIDVVVYA